MSSRTPGPSRARNSRRKAEAAETDSRGPGVLEGSFVDVLWREFKATRSEDSRERLILHFAPLVKYVAGRVSVGLPATIEQADLVS